MKTCPVRIIPPAAWLWLLICGVLGPVFKSGAQTLVADYRFQNSYLSSVGSPPALQPIGSPGNVVENVDGVPRLVLGFDAGEGCRIPGAGAVVGEAYTITILFRFDDTSGWRRLLDFKDRSTDFGLYSYFGNLNFYPFVTGVGGAIAEGEYVQVTLTRSAQGDVRGYVNGNPEIEFLDSGDDAVLSAENVLTFFQDDVVVSGEHSSGAVARIRIWDSPLPPAAVATLDRLTGDGGVAPDITSPGPVTVTAGQTFTFTVTATGDAPLIFSASNLESWMNFDAGSGVLSGIAEAPGVYTVNVSAFNAAGADGLALQVLVVPATGSALSFNPPLMAVREDAGAILVRVVRLGSLSAPASVTYSTLDGTAQEAQHYGARTGSLAFAAGEQVQTISVPVIFRSEVEPDRDFFVVLSGPLGTTIGTPDRVRVVISNHVLPVPPLEFQTGLGLKWPSLTGLEYQVLESSDLTEWEPLDVPVAGTGGQIQFPLSFLPGRRFFQLSVSPAGIGAAARLAK